MIVQTHRLCRLILTTLAIASIMTGRSVIAQEIDFAAESTCEFELNGTEELCGWIEIATHDSCPIPTLAARPVAPTVESKPTPTATNLGSRLSVAATVACASVGVSVEQIVEPFAMVSTNRNNSLVSVQQFIAWWDAAVNEADRLHAVALDNSFNDDVASDDSAVSESDSEAPVPSGPTPVDLESLGPSVLVHVGIEVKPISPLVGGAAMIVTIEESYLPYDLSSNDIKLWSVFPVTTQPFCVRSRAEDLATDSMWNELDNLVKNKVRPEATDRSRACYGSADCLLEELVWRLETWNEEDSQLLRFLDPVSVGRRCGELASKGTRLAKNAAILLATRLKSEKTIELSPSGEALLARAGAIEASVEPMAAQIARAPVATNLR